MMSITSPTPSAVHLPSLLPLNYINYVALSRAPDSLKVFSHGLIDRGFFGLPVTLPIWSKEEKHGPQQLLRNCYSLNAPTL